MLHQFDRRTWAPENDGSGPAPGPGGEATPSDSAPSPPAAPAWVDEMKGSMSELTGVMRGLMQMAEASRQQGGQAPPTPEEPPVDPAHLETLSRKEFSDHIVTQVLKAVNKNVVEPLRGELNAITATTTRGQIQAAVEKSAAAHPDFGDWRQEMIALAGDYRGLPPERLYALARADNPSKARELDEKYTPKPRAQEPIRLRNFGGLTPTQSGTGNRGQRMNGSEAADAAWSETVKALGAEPLFEE